MADVGLSVAYFALLLGLGVLLANILKKKNIPDSFFLLILGLVLGPTLFASPLIMEYVSITLVDIGAMGIIPDFLRILALIMIIFTGMFNLKLRVFKRFSSVSIKLAFIGVVFNTLFLGIIASLLFNIDLVYSFLLGAAVSGTGAGVVMMLDQSLKGFRRPLNILKIESVLNSPIAVLIPLLFLDLVALGPGSIIEPLRYAGTFWQMIAAGIGTGIVVGYAISRIVRGMEKEYSPLLLFSIALITYALAESAGGSGVLAVAVCGLIAGNMMLPGRDEISMFSDNVSEMLRISIFAMLGAQVFLTFNIQEFGLILLFFLLVLISRPLFLLPCLGRMGKSFSRRELLLMSFTAPRGIGTAAMIPIISAAVIAAGSPGMASTMMNIVFMVMLLSILTSTIAAKLLTRESRDSA